MRLKSACDALRISRSGLDNGAAREMWIVIGQARHKALQSPQRSKPKATRPNKY